MRFQLIRTYKGHQDTISSLAAVPGHPKVVSASRDGLMRVWDLRRDTSSIFREGSDSYPSAIYVFPAGFFMVSGAANGDIKLWNLESGEVVRQLKGHEAMITRLAVTHDGQRLVSGSQDRTLRIWDSLTGRIMHVCNDETSGIETLAITPDDKVVLASETESEGSPAHVRAWNVETGKVLANYETDQVGIRDIAVLRDGQHVVSSSKDGDVTVWNRATGKRVRQVKTHLGPIVMGLMPGEKSVVVGAEKPILALWHLETGQKLYQFDEPSDQVASIAVTTDGLYVIAGCRDGSLNFYMRVS